MPNTFYQYSFFSDSIFFNISQNILKAFVSHYEVMYIYENEINICIYENKMNKIRKNCKNVC